MGEERVVKIVIVLDEDLPLGWMTNAAAVLAFSAAKHMNGGVGPEVADADGGIHLGITDLPIPLLACGKEKLRELRGQAQRETAVRCVSFSDVARRAKRYEAYAAELAATAENRLTYLGVCLWGEDKVVAGLTGHLPLVK